MAIEKTYSVFNEPGSFWKVTCFEKRDQSSWPYLILQLYSFFCIKSPHLPQQELYAEGLGQAGPLWKLCLCEKKPGDLEDVIEDIRS